jgi:ABC-type uncharacterized transport system involved in gliding motility auxiliary subunit
MKISFRAGTVLLVGIALLAIAVAIHSIVLKNHLLSTVLAIAGVLLTLWGLFALRREIGSLFKARKGEIALFTLGAVGVLVAIGYLSTRFPMRFDLSEQKEHSLSAQTINMLQHLGKPVHVVFFHDSAMRETVELYELMQKETSKLTVEFHDPMLNPAQARLLGVQFAGTALMQSESRKLTINGPTEVDIANGIMRISQGVTQRVCFLDGHGEADPYSIESHDHTEGSAGHTHGLGDKMIIHEQHGMAKARTALEAMNYSVEKVALLKSGTNLTDCALLVVAGPKSVLLAPEIEAIGKYLDDGHNAIFMLDPFVETGLDPVLAKFGIVAGRNIVIDPTSHFWADPSSPAVTDYNRHQITDKLPLTFFPGALSLSPTPKQPPGVSVSPLVNSSKASFGETTANRAEFNEGQDQPGPTTLMVISNRRPETANNAAAILSELRGEKVTANSPPPETFNFKRARVVVIGDSDFATNSFFHIMGNGKLFLNAVNYLASKENLIGVEPRTFDRPRVNLTNRQMKGTFFLSVILIPLLLAVIGTAVWWRQR